jgi:hypothetical protein
MISADIRTGLLHRLDEVRRLCPEMRLGQLIATLGMLGEDATGRTLWDLEDEELAAALERFAGDLSRSARLISHSSGRGIVLGQCLDGELFLC